MPNIRRMLMARSGRGYIPPVSLTRKGTAGTLWAWGGGGEGEIGQGNTTSYSSPVQIGSDTDWVQVFSGYKALYAIKSSGILYACGLNDNGQLGLDDTTSRSTMTQIGSDAWHMYTGGRRNPSYSHGIKTDGTLWATGRNIRGELGDGTTVSKSSLVQIGSLNTWTHVCANGTGVLARQNDGSLWSWGYDESDRDGLYSSTTNSSPVQIGSESGGAGARTDWAFFGAGYQGGIGVDTSGKLWVWGLNNNGILGDGIAPHAQSIPLQIGALTNWAHHSSVPDNQIFVTGGISRGHVKSDGTLWTWGKADMWGTSHFCGLGDASTSDRSSPVQVGSDTDWVQYVGGYGNQYLLKTNGTLWTYGENDQGQLGLGDAAGSPYGLGTNRSLPTQIGSATDWIWISAGDKTIGAIRST